jgi:hypothetical protein
MNRISSYVILTAFLLLPLLLLGNKDSTKTKKETDTLYIEDYYNALTLWGNTFSKNNNISVVDAATPSRLTYVPNLSACIGPGIGYKWAAIDLSFINFRPMDVSLYGKPKKFDIQGHFHLKKLMIDGNFQYYKGFYLNDYPKAAGVLKPDSTPFVRPDITQLGFGGAIMYAFSWDKYSLPASFSQSQRQKKSKGTWVIGAQLSFFTLGADSNLIPTLVRPEMDSSAYLSGVGSLTFGINGGYMYTFVYKDWYVTGSLVPGFGKQIYIYALLNDTAARYDNSKAAGKFYARLSMGYNGKRFYSGLSIIGETSDFRNSTESYISHNFSTVRFFVGYRFFIRERKIWIL